MTSYPHLSMAPWIAAMPMETYYFFPRVLSEGFRLDLNTHIAWFHALVEETVVSTELVSDFRGPHLLVSRRNRRRLVSRTAQRSAETGNSELGSCAAGKTAFVLGGGYYPGDGIYRYKLSLVPLAAPFPSGIGSRVLNAGVYEELIRARAGIRNGAPACTWRPRPEFLSRLPRLNLFYPRQNDSPTGHPCLCAQ